MNAMIIHGAEGHPKENWFPWLKTELEKLDIEVIVPRFPTPENQTLEEWFKVFDNYKDKIDENSILIGHSLGSCFILSVLEKINHQIKAAFLIAGFIGKLDNKFDEGNVNFTQKEFDFEKIKKNCKNFIVYISDNDPYVNLTKGFELNNILRGQLHISKGAGHFNTDSGYDKFEILLEDIKKYIVSDNPI